MEIKDDSDTEEQSSSTLLGFTGEELISDCCFFNITMKSLNRPFHIRAQGISSLT